MPRFTEKLPPDAAVQASALPLTAEECRRSRYRLTDDHGAAIRLELSRGTVLRQGDLLRDADTGALFRVVARPEPVMTVTASDPHLLLRGAYHLGNRHVALEIGEGYLRLAPDPVLAQMVRQLGLACQEEVAPFQPEAGAYQGHGHSQAHDQAHSHTHAHGQAHDHAHSHGRAHGHDHTHGHSH